jgi:hypothetical protein
VENRKKGGKQEVFRHFIIIGPTALFMFVTRFIHQQQILLLDSDSKHDIPSCSDEIE